ncbi:MAG: alanine--tRNA ligase, partial [Terriglobales bacterium]
PEWFGIDKAKLYVTIFKGENGVPRDAEAYDLWLGQGVPKERVYEFGSKDNFWQMGDTGPCGPCSEIHYDMGAVASDQGHTDCKFGCDCGRYVELWNLVFMQFDRDASGKLTPLPKPSIDTGAGLERMAAVLQGVISNYETDLFTPLIKRAAKLTGVSLRKQAEAEEAMRRLAAASPGTMVTGRDSAASLRVIADHSRAATFLISDGVLPSNEGRSYVLRKIIRRAITHGRLLGQTKPFLNEMVSAVHDIMRDAYPELDETADQVARVIYTEEGRFAHTLDLGLGRFERLLKAADKHKVKAIYDIMGRLDHISGGDFHEKWTASLKNILSIAEGKDASLVSLKESKNKLREILGPKLHDAAWRTLLNEAEELPVVAGDEAFKLYDTFGLPLDFMQDTARDQGYLFDQAGFDRAMAEQQARARASWKGAAKQTANPAYQQLPKSDFEGYRQTRSDNCEVLAIIHNGKGVQQLETGYKGEIILDHTPFYAEAGGQVGDRGWLYSDDHNTIIAEVTGCYYPVQGVRAHQVLAKQVIRVGQKVDAVVDTAIREATMRNHTATHLLQAGLREVLGKHVKQAGSLVAPNHLRFDFSHFTGVAEEELQDIEDIINKEVLRNEKVEIVENVPIDVAVNEYHAMALFGEKYGDKVRVIKIGDFSTELCGGTHTGATGEIGLIKILKEGSVSSGVRRIEAVTGEGSLRHFRKDHELEGVVASLVGPTLAHRTRKDGAPSSEEELSSPAEALKQELEKKDAEIKRLARELDQARMKSASSSTANIGEKVREVRGVKVLTHRVDNLERAQMRTLVDQLRDKLGSAVVVLGSASNGNVSLIVGVTKDLISRVPAGKVIGPVAQRVGGKGGGRPDLAEAGGKDAAALDSALSEAYSVVESLLG